MGEIENEIELEICTPLGGINFVNCTIVDNDQNSMTLFVPASQFEYDKYGIYFGRTVIPQVIADGNRYYIEHVKNNTYELVTIPSSHCFSFQLLAPGLNWNQALQQGLDVRFFNYKISVTTTFSTTARARVSTLSYSISQCTLSCAICGYCPYDLECNGTNCSNSLTANNTVFGLRYMTNLSLTMAITYTPLLGSADTVVLRSIPVIDLAVKDVNQLDYPERVFIIEGAPLVTGTAYPVGIFIGGVKHYLTNLGKPMVAEDDGSFSIVYGITTNPADPNIVVFSSPIPGNWREFTFPPDSFVSISFSEMAVLAFWGSNIQAGLPVVVQAPPVPPTPPIPPSPPLPPPIPVVPPATAYFFWVWIFIVILVFLILLFIFLAFYKWKSRKTCPIPKKKTNLYCAIPETPPATC